MSQTDFFGVEASRDWGAELARARASEEPPHRKTCVWVSAESLVTSRNNLHIASGTQTRGGAFRVPRPYVAACCKGSLGLFYDGGRVVFKALSCGSWSCPTCRKVLAARLLDRLRSGMESRTARRFFVTLTLDPAEFGAVVVGKAIWEGGRETNLWSEPTAAQFARAVQKMSREFNKLMQRLNLRATRAGYERWRYFRVIELHRNGWPHYHVVFEHDELELHELVWPLGISDVRPVSVDDAVGEVAPYLVCAERKGAGSKAYQFAAQALPKHFRLHSSSEGFLGAPVEDDEREKPQHALALRGHFTDHHWNISEDGGNTAIALPAVPEVGKPTPLPSSSVSSGDVAVLYYLRLVESHIEHAPPEWFRQLEQKLFQEHHLRI